MDARDRLLQAASQLLARGGRGAVSTRAVSAVAGVQAPTIYRIFGDKDGLLDAVATLGLRNYLADKHALGETDDPVEDLRRSWDLHVQFGLARPAFYTLIYGEGRAQDSPAGREAYGVLCDQIARVAAAGRLRMSVDRAARIVYAVGVGVVMSLIATPPSERDAGLSAVIREQVLAAVTTDAEEPPATCVGPASRAAALREALRTGGTTVLTAAERNLLFEWLDRIADATDTGPRPANDRPAPGPRP
ncbi:TetR/AcrR family transcriptional regulator [Streptomyces sp. NPDC004629]|uniref:TetR/AcrR family transcriptional regulator n=1 Tax=Streptomyces sp. NPDC004629 TaxID=3364705 RepID=UPI0036AC8692